MAEPHKLSPELVSLVHHIELNKAGWWDLAVRRLVLTAFWVKRGMVALNLDEVRVTLKEEFDITLEESLIRKHLDILQKEGQLLQLQEGRFKLDEETIAECDRQLLAAVELDDAVKDRFRTCLKNYCPLVDHNHAWNAFLEQFLLPTVSELGANTYRLITGSAVETNLPQLQSFIDCFPSEESVGLLSFVRAFLDPTNSSVRRYVLRAMNAYFVVRASGLDEQTVRRLAHSTKQPMVLFIDTNVLFSLLGLHKNPADEGSMALLNLVQKLSTSVPIKLRVLLPTLDEMKRAITASQEAVMSMRISPLLLDTAATVGISGITEKFLRLSIGRGATVSPADYFEPYLKNLLTILRGSGVDLFSQDLSNYRTRQDVVDDLLEQQQFEAQRYGAKAKNYERLEHDIVIWHFVKDKRPLRPESPIDAEYWIVTADYRFLGFDSHRQRKMGTEVPICLHPITLTQLLQFWVPQTPEFEQALLSTMRLPTVLATLDGDAERVSLKILNALSTFENIGNLPSETTTRVLLNEALRQKLNVEDDVTRQVELVREALIEENKRAEQRLNEERIRAGQLQHQSENLRANLTSTISEMQGLREELERQRADASESKLAAKGTEEKLARYIEEGRHRALRRRFVFVWLGILALAVAAALVVFHFLVTRLGVRVASLAILVVLWVWLVDRAGHNAAAVREWSAFTTLNSFRKWIYGSLLTGALGSALWDVLKASFTS